MFDDLKCSDDVNVQHNSMENALCFFGCSEGHHLVYFPMKIVDVH